MWGASWVVSQEIMCHGGIVLDVAKCIQSLGGDDAFQDS
jgi:hypothetical protein